jgi:hypothetical protein
MPALFSARHPGRVESGGVYFRHFERGAAQLEARHLTTDD